MVQKYFGPFEKGPQPSAILEAELSKPAGQTIEMTDDVKLPRVYLNWISPALHAAGDADLDVLSSLLTDGKTSALYKDLVFDQRIAKDVSASQYSRGLAGMYMVTATAAPGQSAEDVQAALEAGLATFLGGDIDPVKVETAINNWKKRFFQRMESVTGRAGMLLNYNNSEGDPGWVQKDLDRYLAVTPESVIETARAVLEDAHRVTIIVRPEPEEGAE